MNAVDCQVCPATPPATSSSAEAKEALTFRGPHAVDRPTPEAQETRSTEFAFPYALEGWRPGGMAWHLSS